MCLDATKRHNLLDSYGIANSFEINRGAHTSAVVDRVQNHVIRSSAKISASIAAESGAIRAPAQCLLPPFVKGFKEMRIPILATSIALAFGMFAAAPQARNDETNLAIFSEWAAQPRSPRHANLINPSAVKLLTRGYHTA